MTRPMYGAVYTGEDYVAPPMTDDEKRMARLPRWARQRIERLERDLAYAKEQVAQVGGEAETDTFMGRSYPEKPQPLPAGSRIIFGPGKRTIEARWENDRLRLTSSGGTLIIEPHVANVVTVRTEDRFQ